jgi:hypothetical protein
MVFSQRFRDTSDSATAFGANLLGAMVGGVLEYTSLIFGYRWLLILVAVLYGLAFATSRVKGAAAVPVPVRAPVNLKALRRTGGSDLRCGGGDWELTVAPKARTVRKEW